jgi:hypothetical protein
MKNISTEIAEIKKSTHPLVTRSEEIVVSSEEDQYNASKFLQEVRVALKNIEAKRVSFTKPINESLRNINATFKEIALPLEKAEATVSKKILLWRQAEQERIAKEEERRRKIQQAHEKKGHNVSSPVVMERPKNTVGYTQSRKIWKYKITDFSKVPDEYKTLNQVAVNEAIREGVREISGLELYQEEILAVSTR